jgi:hypothetical protein
MGQQLAGISGDRNFSELSLSLYFFYKTKDPLNISEYVSQQLGILNFSELYLYFGFLSLLFILFLFYDPLCL